MIIHAVVAFGLLFNAALCKVNTENEVNEIMDVLNRGDQSIKESKHNEIIYVLGPTGTGKSTLTHLIAGDPSLLRSIEIEKDSDDFIIEHVSGDKIGNVTVESKTIYPDLMIDENNVPYYDCPGLSDTRNTSIEFANTYFTKKVISYAERLKIVFVVNYHSMLKGISSRIDFLQFVKHATELLKNVELYSDGIILVASKVPIHSGLKSDQRAIRKITSFLREYQSALSEEMQRNPNPVKLNALKLIHIFLINHRIGLFKRPRKVGLLSENPEVMQNRVELLNLISEKIKFVTKNDEDFGYTLSDRSKLKINALAEEINRKISKLFDQISERIIEFYSNMAVDFNNMENLHGDFDNAINILSKFSSTNMSTSEYLMEVNQLDIPTLQANLTDINNHIDYMRFLQKVHDTPIVRQTSDWARPLQKCLEYLRAQRNWCLFAQNLYNRLSEFEVQKNTSKYDVANVELWGIGDTKKDGGIFINHENFGTFLRKQMDFELVKNTNATEPKIDLLNYILNNTIKSKATIICQKNKLTIKGNFVKISDLETISSCNNVRLMEIFALNTVFVDKDFQKNVDLVIMAPKWYVTETQKRITLDGADGESYPPDDFELSRELVGESINGKSGMAGRDANHFFGYGDEFVNSENLYISAVGGNGGRGQNGYNSRDVEIKTPPHGSNVQYNNLDHFSKYKLTWTSSDAEVGFLFFNRKYWWDEIFQFYARCPSVNGIGGSGGFGGLSGTIELIGKSDINIVSKNGKHGLNGTAGRCGKVPENIEMQKSTAESCIFWFVCNKKVNWKSVGKVINKKCQKNCRSPILVNDTTDSVSVPNKRQNSALSVNQYKSFVRENLFSSSMNRKEAGTILGSIERNSKIKALYDTAAFIDDFFRIEEQFQSFKNENNFLHLYQSLLERILEYIRNRKSNDLDVNERRILASLCTAGLSKICKMRSGTGQNLIIDIKSYLNLAIDHIRKMEKTGKLVAINQLKNEYRQNLERKIYENHAFIVMDILPEIEKLNNQIDSNIETLLDEVLAAKHSTMADIEHSKGVKKLEKSVDMRGMFQFIKIVTKIVSHFDVFSTVVTETINTAVQIANTFTLDNEKRMPSKKISFTPSNESKGSYFGIESSSKPKSSFILNILDEILTVAAHSSFDDIFKLVTETKTILSGGKRVDLSSQEIDLLQDNVQSILRNKTDEVKANLYQNETDSLNALEKINKKLSLLEMDPDLFSKFATNEHKVHEVEAIMRQSQHRLEKLKKVERNYLQLVDPLVKYLHQLFSRIPFSSIDQTTYELVTKWHIQNTLKDIRFRMQQVSIELKFEGNLLHTLDKLDVAFTTLISIYDQAQIYEEQVKLGTYIASIELADSSNEMNSLNLDLQKLNAVIQSNVLLTIFDNAVNGFKQTIFPFADFYLHRFDVPPQLAVAKTFDILVKEATDELENLKFALQEYNSASINDNDNIIHTADFTSNFKSSQPFYVWTGQKHNEIITQLFSGKAITVKADITKGVKLNAVKFQHLEIHLKSWNQTNQAKLNQILEHFDVTIVHHGNSYYRCDKKFYLIESPSQRIEYSFEKDANGLPIRRNNVYLKIRNGDFTLSPYALLTISIKPRKSVEFKFLNDEFGGRVDLELIGHGQYVNPNNDACQNLEKYYKADELVAESDEKQFV